MSAPIKRCHQNSNFLSQNFRDNGLERFAWTEFFERLKKRRETELREVPADSVRDFVAAASAASGAPSAMLGT